MAWELIAEVYGTAKRPYKVSLQTAGASRGDFGCSCPRGTWGKKSTPGAEEMDLPPRREFRLLPRECKHVESVRAGICMSFFGTSVSRTIYDLGRRVDFALNIPETFRLILTLSAGGFALEQLTAMAAVVEAQGSANT